VATRLLVACGDGSALTELVDAAVEHFELANVLFQRRKTDSPTVFRVTSSTGVVRARSSIRSDCNTREMKIFWPLTT